MRYLVERGRRLPEGLARAAGARLERPRAARALARVNAEWRAVLTEAFDEPHREFGIAMPLEALVSLVVTFNHGIIVERLGGIETGHAVAARLDRRLRRSGDDGRAAAPREQTRARYPDESGYVERDGVRLYYEVYGEGEPTVLLLPTWSIIHSRYWKMQIPYLARHCRVLDVRRPRQRPVRPPARAALRRGGVRRRRARRDGRDRAPSARCSSPFRRARSVRCCSPPSIPSASTAQSSSPVPAARRRRDRSRAAWTGTSELDTDEGWAKYNRHYWLERLPRLPRVLLLADVHRAALDQADRGLRRLGARDDAGDADRDRSSAPRSRRGRRPRALCARVRCPVLVIHGIDDAITGPARGVALAEATGGALVMLEGSGHAPHARDPVKVNLLLRDFVAPPAPGIALGARPVAPQARALHLLADRPRPRAARRGDRRRAAQAAPRPRDRLARAASGHRGARGARRADPSRRARCSPTSRATSRASRPSTTCTASRRSAGWTRSCSRTSWSSTTSCARSDYDLWIGDEAWELDYYLHENPEQKRAAYVWLTDFVGWLPMPDGGEREALPDRRLQRRDDRAHRALPARARPRGLRRQPRRHRARTRSAPTCR